MRTGLGRWRGVGRRRGKRGGSILRKRTRRRRRNWVGMRVEELLVGNGMEKRGDFWSGFDH